jgi:hypothetical protein
MKQSLNSSTSRKAGRNFCSGDQCKQSAGIHAYFRWSKLNQNLPQILGLGVEYAATPELALMASANFYFLNYADLVWYIINPLEAKSPISMSISAWVMR